MVKYDNKKDVTKSNRDISEYLKTIYENLNVCNMWTEYIFLSKLGCSIRVEFRANLSLQPILSHVVNHVSGYERRKKYWLKARTLETALRSKDKQ